MSLIVFILFLMTYVLQRKYVLKKYEEKEIEKRIKKKVEICSTECLT